MAINAALIFNPKAGSWHSEQRVDSIRQNLEGSGYSVQLLPTARPGHGTEIARQAVATGAEVVFAYGGDGTRREGGAGLSGSAVALAPIPGGTANVVARALGLPLNPIKAAAVFANATTIETDVGMCGDEPFLMLTSAGLDAHVMGSLHAGMKRRLGRVAVGWAALQSLSSYKYPLIRLLADGQPYETTFAAICNLPYYAGSWKLAPGASMTSGSLELVLFHGRTRLQTLAFARDLGLGRHTKRDDVEIMRVDQVELLGPSDLPVQLDGDALGFELPITLTVGPQRLKLLAPANTVP